MADINRRQTEATAEMDTAAQQVLRMARKVAVQFGAAEVEPAHVFVAATRVALPVSRILARAGFDLLTAWNALDAVSPRRPTVYAETDAIDSIPLGQDVQAAIDRVSAVNARFADVMGDDVSSLFVALLAEDRGMAFMGPYANAVTDELLFGDDGVAM